MFLTFTPNPCIERTLRLQELTTGESRRIDSEKVFVSPGGKGINAARVATRCGANALALAPIGQVQLPWFQQLMERDAVQSDFLAVTADTRICVNLIHDGGVKTELIEEGCSVSIQEGTALIEKWQSHLKSAKVASIGGSYAPSAEPGFDLHAALLCDLASRAGVPVIYDGKGAPFARALKGKTPPWAIKPNLEEAAQFLGRSIESVADERRAVRDLLARGVEVVLLSCGSRGLHVGHKDGIEWFAAPKVDVISPVGSGDSLVGAFAARWMENGDIFEAASWGVAAGSACAAQEKPAYVEFSDIKTLLPQVKHSTPEISLRLL